MTQRIDITPGAVPRPASSAVSPIQPILMLAIAAAIGVGAGMILDGHLRPTPTPSPAPPAPPPAVAITGPASATVGRQAVLTIKAGKAARTEWALPAGDFTPFPDGTGAAFTPTTATPNPAVFSARSLAISGSDIVETPGTPFSLPIVSPTPVTPPTPITPPSPGPQTDGGNMGRALLAGLPGVEVAGEQAESAAILSGSNMAAVMAAGKAARQAAYSKTLEARAPVLGKIIPEGTEPPDQATRAKWAAAVADSISSLGGGK